MKIYNKAPLPFIGQKRKQIENFTQVLNEIISNNGEGWTIVDVFGGSGLLSHNAKVIKPQARVVYNDFDYYTNRLKKIHETEKFRQFLCSILQPYTFIRDDKITQDKCLQITDYLQNNDCEKIDLTTASSYLLFSASQVGSWQEFLNKAKKQQLFNRVSRTPIVSCDDYLQDVEIVHQDFIDLMPYFSGQNKTLLILDPPYLNTHCSAYNNANYFALNSFVHMVHLMQPPFIVFGSDKSEILPFMKKAVELEILDYEKFTDIKIFDKTINISKNQKYQDYLIYKASEA